MEVQRLGPYRLLERIGAGGMGEVFLASLEREQGFSRRLAIKRILPALSADPAFRELFAAEARLAASLSHPNVLLVTDYGRDGDACYLAMEHVDGADLARLCQLARARGKAFEADFVLAAGLGCARALGYAHGLSPALVHGDVNPHNLLAGRQGELKLADFGLARLRGASGGGPSGGKPAYMPPEIARGQSADERSDLYGLGAVLFELVCGQPPVDIRGCTPEQAVERARRSRVPPAASLALQAHPALCRVIDRALVADPLQRYPDAQELEEDLMRVAAGLGCDAGPRAIERCAGELLDAPIPQSGRDAPAATLLARSHRPQPRRLALGSATALAAALLAAGLILDLFDSPGTPVVVAPAPRASYPIVSKDISSDSDSLSDSPGTSAKPDSTSAKPDTMPDTSVKPSTSVKPRIPEKARGAKPVLHANPDSQGAEPNATEPESPAPESPGTSLACLKAPGSWRWRLDQGEERSGPIDLALLPGAHLLRIRGAGLQATLRLERRGAGLRLVARSRPFAVLRIDGKPRGLTPIADIEIGPGTHRISLAAQGAEPLRLELELPEIPSD
ncbi:MAG: serine/threonine protein kinase [Deltaproteobacteria bacterium]|nr:serine/threonine protein kinase [Deltaproteobacteria bacterium]